MLNKMARERYNKSSNRPLQFQLDVAEFVDDISQYTTFSTWFDETDSVRTKRGNTYVINLFREDYYSVSTHEEQFILFRVHNKWARGLDTKVNLNLLNREY